MSGASWRHAELLLPAGSLAGNFSIPTADISAQSARDHCNMASVNSFLEYSRNRSGRDSRSVSCSTPKPCPSWTWFQFIDWTGANEQEHVLLKYEARQVADAVMFIYTKQHRITL